jgi:Zn-dependent M28 family amino/carboxypeptidase
MIIFTSIIISCRNTADCKPKTKSGFNADSAYNFIKRQVSFGSRVPNTSAHDSCAIYLEKKLKSYGADVIVQRAKVKKFDGEELEIENIIGQIEPQKRRRIMLYAHWDSRYYADMEKNPAQRLIPISGANDGASGVGVLLEIARNLQKKSPKIGVDIIFFDAEDQGEPIEKKIFNERSWSLGTQYWCKHPHKKNYKAFLGICLDMVGDSSATFLQEDNSRFYNNFTVKRLWKLAKTLGYEKYFPQKFSGQLYDDNLFVSQDYGIRSILIIDNKAHKKIPFFKYWHTHSDTIDKIDTGTLKAVGDVVLQYVYCLK